MAEPYRADVASLKWVFEGEVFNDASSAVASNTQSLAFTAEGLPFTGNDTPIPVTLTPVDDSLFLNDTPTITVEGHFDDSMFLDDLATLIHVVPIDDEMFLDDANQQIHVVPVDDETFLEDEFISNVTIIDDSMFLADDFSNTIEVVIDDSMFLDDSIQLTVVVNIDDSMFLSDTASTTRIMFIDDSMFLSDTVTVARTVNPDDSMFLSDTCTIVRSYQQNVAGETQIVRYAEENFAGETALAIYNAPPITSLGPSNNFDPTIAIDGTMVNTGTSTDPGTYNSFLIVPSGLGIAGNCDVQSFTINLSLGGGSFEITTKFSLGQPGDLIQLAGLPFIITEPGTFIQGNQSGYQTRGIFGDSRELNRKILLAATSNELTRIRGLFPAFPIASPPATIWGSVIEAAQVIAAKAGISLVWQAPNAPLLDTFVESGMATGDAIRSLASRVGGILTFDGTTWVVIDPVRGFGGWTPPSMGDVTCNLISGSAATNHLDLEGEMVVIPIDLQTQVPEILLPAEAKAAKKERVEMLGGSITRRPKESEPAILIDAPGDFKNPARVQIIAADADALASIPGAQPDTETGRNSWSPASFPVETRDYGKKQIIVRREDIPAAAEGKKFRMNVGYVRNIEPRQAQLSELAAQTIQKKRLLLQSQQESMRYFQMRTGQFSMVFYGTLPIPGNRCSMVHTSADGIIVDVEGIVTSVNFTGPEPANLQIQIAQFVRLNMQTPQSILDRYAASNILG